MSKEGLNFEDQRLMSNLETYQNNKELIGMYDEYIRRIVELFSIIIKNNSDLYYSIVFSKILHSGYFSADKKYSSKKATNQLNIKYGINIVNGDGTCLSIAYFYSDIFKHFYDYVLRLCCFYDDPTDSEDYKKKTRIIGNHIINLAKYCDEIYGIDKLWELLFELKNEEIIEERKKLAN